MRICDLFAGIGGLSKPFVDLGCEVVFASEIDKHAADVYELNHGMRPAGDITKIDAQDIPDFDLLLAGFPCQPFSIIGNRRGVSDDRGRMFDHIERIISAKSPLAFLLENVPHLLTMDKGSIVFDMWKRLEALGYTVDYKVLNSNNFGTCQRRKRLYIVGRLDRGLFDCFLFPEGLPNRRPLRDYLDAIPPEKAYLEESLVSWMMNRWHKKNSDVANKRKAGFAPTLLNGSETATPTLLASKRWKKGDEMLTLEDGRPRELTPRECARLQGFPDDFVLHGQDQKAFKQIGNSVHQGTVKAIAAVLLKDLKKKQNNL